ncbi:hypothetical protein B0I21_104253 [Sphingobacterium paludis]|uniref:Uncharacterized protein n=1 Tax=Sphingobacterium paludis TaxID=1476465 RepID=A0A4R7D4Y2_9SPHI|nr:hypothetical protein B0I21_104253 [Sphingobacterium paludis]
MPRQGTTFDDQKVAKVSRLKPLQGWFVHYQMYTYCKAFDATYRLRKGRSNKAKNNLTLLITHSLRITQYPIYILNTIY